VETSAAEDSSLRLVFPRRAGLAPAFYGFETSPDLAFWTPAVGVRETVLSTEVIDGVAMEVVEAVVPLPNAQPAFVHLRWPKP
jgi:hypothetical protein